MKLNYIWDKAYFYDKLFCIWNIDFVDTFGFFGWKMHDGGGGFKWKMHEGGGFKWEK